MVHRHNCAAEGFTRAWLGWGPKGGRWIVEETPARVHRRIRLLRDCYYTCSIGISSSICPDYRGSLSCDKSPVLFRVQQKEQCETLERLRNTRAGRIRHLRISSIPRNLNMPPGHACPERSSTR